MRWRVVGADRDTDARHIRTHPSPFDPVVVRKMAAICSAVNCKFLVGAKVGARKTVRARATVAAPVQAKARVVFAPLRCAKRGEKCMEAGKILGGVCAGEGGKKKSRSCCVWSDSVRATPAGRWTGRRAGCRRLVDCV